MKKVMIGGFTALVGALGALAVFLAAALNKRTKIEYK